MIKKMKPNEKFLLPSRYYNVHFTLFILYSFLYKTKREEWKQKTRTKKSAIIGK